MRRGGAAGAAGGDAAAGLRALLRGGLPEATAYIVAESFEQRDTSGDGALSRDELVHFLEDLHAVTGATLPSDEELRAEVLRVFRAHDKNCDRRLDSQEAARFLLSSDFRERLCDLPRASRHSPNPQRRNPAAPLRLPGASQVGSEALELNRRELKARGVSLSDEAARRRDAHLSSAEEHSERLLRAEVAQRGCLRVCAAEELAREAGLVVAERGEVRRAFAAHSCGAHGDVAAAETCQRRFLIEVWHVEELARRSSVVEEEEAWARVMGDLASGGVESKVAELSRLLTELQEEEAAVRDGEVRAAHDARRAAYLRHRELARRAGAAAGKRYRWEWKARAALGDDALAAQHACVAAEGSAREALGARWRELEEERRRHPAPAAAPSAARAVAHF